MAEAVRVEAEVQVIKPAGIQLFLNEDEAKVLRDILHNVGGPYTGRRKFASDITNALAGAGVFTSKKEDMQLAEGDQSIYFK